MESDIDSEDDYKDVPYVFRAIFQVFRTSLGDMQLIGYKKWSDKETGVKFIAMFIAWFLLIFNSIVMQVILLNLVIAQVGQSYEKAINLAKQSINQERALLN